MHQGHAYTFNTTGNLLHQLIPNVGVVGDRFRRAVENSRDMIVLGSLRYNGDQEAIENVYIFST